MNTAIRMSQRKVVTKDCFGVLNPFIPFHFLVGFVGTFQRKPTHDKRPDGNFHHRDPSLTQNMHSSELDKCEKVLKVCSYQNTVHEPTVCTNTD